MQTPARYFHPLFAGMMPSLIDWPCASTFQRLAQGLGFLSVCERIPHGLDAFPEAVQRHIDDGYRLAARWTTIGGDVLLYIKPTTAFAQVIWLAGLGVIEQAEPREASWAQNATHADTFCGWHETREKAVAEGQEAALQSGRRQFETRLYTLPLASQFVTAEDVLQQMYDRAQDEAGEAADGFPHYGKAEEALLEQGLALLVDGWAVATRNVPNFSGSSEQAQTHDVFDPRSLAP